MTDFSALLQQGVANAWLFIPSAILLGALHGLEPGHSKTMMAAFIVAIRGTVKQAVLLGLAATISHTSVVWLIAMGGMYVSQKFTAESAEPWFQLISGVLIVAIALWMAWRTWKESQPHDHHHHDHGASPIHDVTVQSISLRGGEMIAQGEPEEMMRGDVLEQIYGIPMGILPHPAGGAPVSFVY